MTDALKPVKLIVYGFTEEKFEQVKAMLAVLSGLNVDRRGSVLLGRKLYTYFDDVASAKAAASALVNITCCSTKIRVGTFDVTNLVKDTHKATLKDLKLQSRVSKTSLAKDANSAINAIKRSKTERHYKDIEENQ